MSRRIEQRDVFTDFRDGDVPRIDFMPERGTPQYCKRYHVDVWWLLLLFGVMVFGFLWLNAWDKKEARLDERRKVIAEYEQAIKSHGVINGKRIVFYKAQ